MYTSPLVYFSFVCVGQPAFFFSLHQHLNYTKLFNPTYTDFWLTAAKPVFITTTPPQTALHCNKGTLAPHTSPLKSKHYLHMDTFTMTWSIPITTPVSPLRTKLSFPAGIYQSVLNESAYCFPHIIYLFSTPSHSQKLMICDQNKQIHSNAPKFTRENSLVLTNENTF